MLSQGVRTHFNYRIFTNPIGGPLFRRYWRLRRGKIIEGINAGYAKLRLPSEIARSIPASKFCAPAAFSMHRDRRRNPRRAPATAYRSARSLIANPNLPEMLQTADGPPAGKECTYCNKCLINDLENPLGCYELSRFEGSTFEERYEAMIAELMSVFEPPTFH